MNLHKTVFILILMVLTNADILELIKKPENGKLLRTAVHEEQVLKALSTGEYADVVVDEFAKLLVEERRKKFKDTFGFHTTPILDKVSTHYERIFAAQGRLIEAKFSKPEQKQDFELYTSKCYVSDNGKLNGIDAETFFRHIGLNALLYQPNTIAYLDMPSFISGETRSSPTVQVVSVSNIWDIVATAKGIEYLIIYNEKKDPENGRKKIKQYIVIDEEKYALYENTSGNIRLISEAKHLFEVCPATFIANQNRYKDKYSFKQSPIWQSIDDLKAWLLLKNFAKVYGWESGVPTKFEAEPKCSARHSTGVGCEDGKFFLTDGNIAMCPKCHRRTQEKISWGKTVTIPMDFMTKDGADLFFKTFQYADFSTDVMNFHEQDLARKRNQIEEDLIGEKGNSTKTKEARNELDVQSDTEDMKRILSSASEVIEQRWNWLECLIAKSRNYDSFVDFTVFLGRGYLLQSKAQHQAEYSNLVLAGADDYVLNKKLAELIQSDYGYDEKFIELFDMLGAIIPFRHLPIEKVYAQQSTLLLNEQTKRDFYLRIYAANWIQEFLVLNNIQIWGIELSPEDKFNALREYFSERIDSVLTNPIS